MLKKSALLPFGLVLLVVCLNPPRANAGVLISIGPAYPRPVRVYAPPVYVVPSPYIGYRAYPYIHAPAYAYPGPIFFPNHYYRHAYWTPRRWEYHEYVLRRPYWRR